MSEKPQIHMPSPSIWPLVLAASLLLVSLGVVGSKVISLIGVVLLLAAIGGWAFENRSEVSHHE
ncbi:MAG TPA: cytochrome c oxidase subunit 4 [Anaerolineales bacterium]|nr:cytochrome c oxidase subunit 4 [Anaerolineales bacterium]